MKFDFFMLFVDLILPLIMFISSFFFIKGGPKNINSLVGYRTERSMKNTDTWAFAHKYCGKLWQKIGLIFIIITLAVLVPFILKTSVKVYTVATFVIFSFEFVLLFYTIFKTEKALSKAFDKNGERVI